MMAYRMSRVINKYLILEIIGYAALLPEGIQIMAKANTNLR